MDDSNVMKILRHLEGLKTISSDQFNVAHTKKASVAKYLLSFPDLLEMLSNERKEFYLVAADMNLLKDVEVTYYDTSELTFYRQFLVGGLYKLKIRSYYCVQSQISFFEVIDYNPLRKSSQINLASHLFDPTTLSDPQVASFIKKFIPTSPSLLSPVLGVSYKHFELMSCDGSELLSISFNLNFHNKSDRKYLDHTVIAEVRKTHSSKGYFGNLMQRAGANEINVSKYNLGFLMLYPTFDLTKFGKLHKYMS